MNDKAINTAVEYAVRNKNQKKKTKAKKEMQSNLPVLPLSVWVVSGFSGLLPQTKDVCVRLIGNSKLAVDVRVKGCCGPVINWRLVLGSALSSIPCDPEHRGGSDRTWREGGMETKTVMNQCHYPLSCPIIAAELFSNEAVAENVSRSHCYDWSRSVRSQ